MPKKKSNKQKPCYPLSLLTLGTILSVYPKKYDKP